MNEDGVEEADVTTAVPPEPAAHVPWRSRTVQVVLLSTLLAPLGVPLVAPALPVLRDVFAVTDAQASLLVSAYFVVGVFVSPVVGVIADRIGRKRVLVASLFAFAASGGAAAFAPTFEILLVLRALQGTAAAGLFITTVTLVGDVFSGAQRNAVLGVNVAVLSTGAALFPIVGGALVAVSWNVPFLLYLLAVPVGLFAARVLPEPDVERETHGVTYIAGALRSLANRESVLLYGTAFTTELLTFGALVTALPFLLFAEFALTPVLIGLVITAGEGAAIVASSLNGRFARHLSNVGLIAVGFAAYGVGLVVAWTAPTPAVVALGAVAFGAGLGFSMPAVDAAISELVAGRYRAEAISLRNSTTFLGRATGPIVFTGIAAVVGGYRPLLLASGLVAFGLALLAVASAGGPRGVQRQPATDQQADD